MEANIFIVIVIILDVNTEFCHETLDGTVRSQSDNDIIIQMVQVIGFFLHQQPMSLQLNIQILSCSL